jgi:hypothetical protein
MIHAIFGRSYVYHNDMMFYVVRVIRESHKPIVETWKEHLQCDTVLKKEGFYYFCQKVHDTEVIEYEQI